MCEFCQNHERGDTLYESSDWDGGIGFDYIRDIKYCPLCGRKLDSEDEPNSSEIPNNCEPKICDTCRYYSSYIPCGSTPSACKEADKFAEEFVDGLKKLKPQTEPQTNADQHVQHVESVEPTWTREEHEAFYTFLWNVINPNEMQDYIGMFEAKTEPQTYITEDRDTQILDAWQVKLKAEQTEQTDCSWK